MGNIFVQLYRAPDRGAIIRREIAKNRDRLRWLLGMPPPREPNGTQECDAEEAGVESSRYLLAEWQGATVLLDRTSLVDK